MKIQQTIEEIKKVQAEAQEKRKQESIELAKVEHNIDSLIGNATMKIDSATKGVSLLE